MLKFGSLVGWLLFAANLMLAQSFPANVGPTSQAVLDEAKTISPAKMRQMALQFEEGRGVHQDLATAFRLYERAASLGDSDAQVQLGYMFASGRGTTADPKEAFRWFLRAASDGNRRAQYDVAVAYLRGSGVRSDPAEGLAWLRKSAEQGDPVAEADLGGLYAAGHVVAKDCRLARQWSEKAAKKANARAEANLAAAELGECDGQRNIPRALKLLRRSAAHGDAATEYQLGKMLAEGNLVPRDDAAALNWFIASASQGTAIAQFAAGLFYEFGRGLPGPDYPQAAQSYLAASSQDYAPAEINLGSMLERGLVPGHAASEALHWYERAAQQGQPGAQMILAKHYEEGVGVARDLATAAEWYRKAAPQLDAAQAALSKLLASHPELVPALSAKRISSCDGPPKFGLLPGDQACLKAGEKR